MGYFLSITKIEEKAQKFKPAVVKAMHYQWQEKKDIHVILKFSLIEIYGNEIKTGT